MDLIKERFSIFVNISLRLLFLLVLLGSIGLSFAVLIKLPMCDIVSVVLVCSAVLLVTIGGGYLTYKYIKLNKNYKIILLIILAVAFIIRLLWILLVDVAPISDFRVIYKAGGQFAKGNYSTFKGTGYIARFPHLTITSIYFGIIQKIFTHHALLVVRLINIALSTFNVYMLYLIGNELYGSKKKGLWIAFLSSIFPPFIIYNLITCSENLAMPFFLASIYIFMLVVKGKKGSKWLVISALLLSIGNLFRMVGPVIVVAYILYLIVYWQRKKVVKASLSIILTFLIPLYITNTVLLSQGITEYPLWKGREPAITSVLRGTNLKSIGTWTVEDSEIPKRYNNDYKAVEDASKAIIKERLTTTPVYKLIPFYIAKFIGEWSLGDFAGMSWCTDILEILNTSADLTTYVSFYSQIFYVIMLLFVYRGLFNKKQYLENKEINLFYIIFCGYGLLYLITELQQRYAYIISFVFVILAFSFNEEVFMRRLNRRNILRETKANNKNIVRG